MIIYRVFFFTGPPPKSSKCQPVSNCFQTGPPLKSLKKKTSPNWLGKVTLKQTNAIELKFPQASFAFLLQMLLQNNSTGHCACTSRLLESKNNEILQCRLIISEIPAKWWDIGPPTKEHGLLLGRWGGIPLLKFRHVSFSLCACVWIIIAGRLCPLLAPEHLACPQCPCS